MKLKEKYLNNNYKKNINKNDKKLLIELLNLEIGKEFQYTIIGMEAGMSKSTVLRTWKRLIKNNYITINNDEVSLKKVTTDEVSLKKD